MAIIEAIERLRSQVRIVVSDAEDIYIPHSLFRARPLHEEDELDLEEYENWLLLHQYRPALEKAVALLAARAHSKHEIEVKLQRAGYRPAVIEMVLYKLQKESLLDDSDFARQWVAARSNRKLGKRRIAQELRYKGISSEEAEAALDDMDEEEELSAATALAEKATARNKPGEDPRKSAQRILSMLVRRGYSWDTAKAAVSRAMADLDD